MTHFRYVLVTTTRSPENLRRGFMDAPLYRSWEAKTLAGLPVTVAEHNAAIVALAFERDCVAADPGQPFTFLLDKREGGDRLVVGWRPFQSGSAVLVEPAAPNPMMALDARARPAPQETMDVTEAGRRRVYDWLGAAMSALKVTPDQVVPAPTPPGGLVQAVPVLIGLAIIVVGLASGYAVHEVQETQRYAIRQSGENARYIAQENARVGAYTARLNCLKDSRSAADCPLSPVEVEASGTGVHTEPNPDAWKANAVSAAKEAAIVLGVTGVLTLGVIVGANVWAARREAQALASAALGAARAATAA